jgi:tryptophan-rich sensory protein
MVREFATPGRTRGGFQRAAVLIGFLALSLGVGILAELVAGPNILSWYPSLTKPSFNPPNWAFAPVWSTLYVFIAIAGWRVWCVTDFNAQPMLYWLIQLALNAAWPFIFFGAHQLLAALIEIAMLLIAVLITTVAFFRIDRIAGWLFVPYLLWVSFAGALNLEIYSLNPGI